MPGLLEEGVRAAMRGPAQPQSVLTQSDPRDPTANLQEASDEDEQYVDDVWRVVASRLYTERTADQIEQTLKRAPEQVKPMALIEISKVYMDVANEAMRNMPVPPPEGADHQLTDMIVDAVLEIGAESGAIPTDEEGEIDENLVMNTLVGARKAFIDGHPELYGERANGRLQSQPGTGGTGGGSR